MTPLEWLIAALVSWWVLRGILGDLHLLARGRTPARLAAGRTRTTTGSAGGGGGRYGLRSYLADAWSDGWRTARARREARVAARLAHIHQHGPGPTWRQRASQRWAAAWERMSHRMADRWHTRQQHRDHTTPRSGHPPGTSGRGTTPGPERHTGPQPRPDNDHGNPGHRPGGNGSDNPGHRPDNDHSNHSGQDHDHGNGPDNDHDNTTGRGGGERVDAHGPQEPDHDQDGAVPRQVIDARLVGGRWTTNDQPDGVRPGGPGPGGHGGRESRTSDEGSHPMAEATGLTSAIQYAGGMQKTHEKSVSEAEQWAASLASHGVSGPAVDAARRAAEAQQQAAAAWQEAHAALERHTQVKEAYTSNADAGSKEFVTSE